MSDIFGVPLLKKARDHFKVEEEYISKDGKLTFGDQIELREFARRLNEGKDIIFNAAKTITPGELNAVLILSGLIKKVINKYNDEISPKIISKVKTVLVDRYGQSELDDLDKRYRDSFVNTSSNEFLIETLLIWLINQNPSIVKLQELFDDVILKDSSVYPDHIDLLKKFFKNQPAVKNKKDLISFLLEPMLKFPDSIYDQLNFIKVNWKDILDNEMLDLLQGIDLLREENKPHFTGPGPTQIHQFKNEEYEKFTKDKDWMPHLVLIAKSTYVWLDQLSKKYKKEIKKLDQIPMQELELQVSRGITGIWLIGIWQRSAASKRIKELNGDRDAIASAYSLEDYRIADELGGEEAMEVLKSKALQVGIRIGCDMVPNHTGLDSTWIVEHPEWFLQLDHLPFPSYTFTGENLSSMDEIQIKIEDHYFEKTDAAVVFQYIKDGKTRYIYHGNDGTSTPWNDTAQLNYLLPEVRKAVSDKIIGIAKKFPIIRFDAAMTLAKKHVQRLWFPQPGSGGDIATRSEHGMSKAEFNKFFPNEFWREVVDRAATEAPDTLLLAEAFWMMEGYFVRTLGMHRVYNSAFMNMLKKEENAKYRKSIFNILQFNPQILKRFVNFMSNPDEDTAIAQFGKDDKYFGVCIMMSTMPGLPMFAHGQVEGFTERYGMEFKKAKWQENEDKQLIERHNREIFPLLNKRYLFSEVENFILYDFVTEDGELNENVFAYSNQFEEQYSLVVYNNKFQQTSGWINWANTPKEKGEQVEWIKINLGPAWNLHNKANYFVIFQNEISGLEFIRNSKEIHQKGLFQNLGAFKYAVFTNIYEVKDDFDKHYAQLAKYLQGGGVESIQHSLKRIELLPLLEKFDEFLNWEILSYLLSIKDLSEYLTFKGELIARIEDFIIFLKDWINSETKIEKIIDDISNDLDHYFKKLVETEKSEKYFSIFYILWRHLGKLRAQENYELISRNWLDEFFLAEEISKISKIDIDTELLKICIIFQNLWKKEEKPSAKLKKLLNEIEVENYLKVNKYDDKIWFNKEAFDELIDMLETVNLISAGEQRSKQKKFSTFIKQLKNAEKSSEYQIGKLLTNILEV